MPAMKAAQGMVSTQAMMMRSPQIQRTERTPLVRSEEHTSELQSQSNIVCRLLLEKKIIARVEWNLAQAKRNYGATEAQEQDTARRFFRIIPSLHLLPKSSTLMHAGLALHLLSACL